jgi:hypothetical protein
MLIRNARHAARFLVPLVGGGLLFLTGCPGETPQAKKPATTTAVHSDHDDHGHHHHHAEKGPHDGALVAIGEDDAHLEFVLNADTGKLTAYVLDGEAEKPVRIKQANLQVVLTLTRTGDSGDGKDELPDETPMLTMEAVSPADGMASEFAGQSDQLKGAEKFSAVLTSVNVGDKSFKNVDFKYPEGNEEEHHH